MGGQGILLSNLNFSFPPSKLWDILILSLGVQDLKHMKRKALALSWKKIPEMAFGSNEIWHSTDETGNNAVLAIEFTSKFQGCMGH